MHTVLPMIIEITILAFLLLPTQANLSNSEWGMNVLMMWKNLNICLHSSMKRKYIVSTQKKLRVNSKEVLLCGTIYNWKPAMKGNRLGLLLQSNPICQCECIAIESSEQSPSWWQFHYRSFQDLKQRVINAIWIIEKCQKASWIFLVKMSSE